MAAVDSCQVQQYERCLASVCEFVKTQEEEERRLAVGLEGKGLSADS